jgi:hypothetical protein
MTDETFPAAARRVYAGANAATLRWMLERPPLAGRFINTKLHPVTLRDYDAFDGHRAPRYVYGWIQGRGLEALATHAAFFGKEDAALAAALDGGAMPLYEALDGLQARDGHGYFTYDAGDAALTPVFPDAAGAVRPQERPAGIFTYSDAFLAKGLLAAGARLGKSADRERHLRFFAEIVEAIEAGHFQIDERTTLSERELALQPDDFGPRMILLGAAGMLARIGLAHATAFADRFIEHVLRRHYDPASGLLRNVPGQDACNVGHGIEFVGFALDHIGGDPDPELSNTLERILVSSFRAGFVGPGIALSVSAATGATENPLCPWWSLPETIRSAALCHARSGSRAALDIWKAAHEAFFGRYWRSSPPVAYQTMTAEGPIDYVPATPDLDPGYHTGLSLLAAIEVADALAAPETIQEAS